MMPKERRKEIECEECGYISFVASWIPLKQAWCPECRSDKIRLYRCKLTDGQRKAWLEEQHALQSD